jgi:penicillin-binding protein 1C
LIHEARIDSKGRRLLWVSLADISPALIAAVLASEDRRFYQHGGVDARALAAAALQWAKGGPRRGGSTISMQVAAFLTPDLRRGGGGRTLLQKWGQIRYARALESQWSKQEILEVYLNRVTFRGELQGVPAAAIVLFGKAPHGLTEAEAAVLSALLRAPNAEQASLTHRAWAIREAAGGRSTRAEIAAAAAAVMGVPTGVGPRVTLAPHVAQRLLARSHGKSATRETIRTSLDGTLQRLATEILKRYLLAAQGGHVQDGAILVVENASGDVLAYVGSSGSLSDARHVDGVRASRQAGSTLKPFLYGLALEERLLTAASLIQDAPLELAQPNGLYRPMNYDAQFKGLLSVRMALAGSVNVPAVKTLTLVGAEAFVGQLARLGFEGVTESGEFYGPSLALGSAEVSLWELTNAYRSFANGGRWTPLALTPAPHPPAPTRRTFSEATAFILSHILSDRESRSVTFGLENPLATRFWTAVKTGTSKDMRDNWCIGYSRRYTVGVWVGNFSGEPMRDVSGVTGAAPIWLELMTWLHRTEASPPPRPPKGVIGETVAFPRQTEPDRIEWFLQGTEPARASRGLAAGHPRIVAPTPGTTIALDPDIPASRQRVVFEAQSGGTAIRWNLDAHDLGSAGDLVLWRPRPGGHMLLLLDEEGNVLDRAPFEVRGGVKLED